MPLTDDPDFLRRVADKAKNMPGGGGLDLVTKIAPYISRFVEAAQRQLETLAARDPRVEEAFSPPNSIDLLASVGAVLAFYAAHFHNKQYEADPQGLNNDADAQDVTDLQDRTHNLAAHALYKNTLNFCVNMSDFVNKLLTDWADLQRVFFSQYQLLALRKVDTTGSDSHKQGQQVLILTFYVQPAVAAPQARKGVLRVARFGLGLHNSNANQVNVQMEKKLVYKPSDVELDCRLVGDTYNLRGRLGARNDLPDLSAGSLFELVNQRLSPPTPLPVYLIWPRRPASLMTPDVNGSLPIYQSYGWIEFLTHDPPDADAQDPRRLKRYPPDQRDWITSDSGEVTNFYSLHGWYAALGIAFAFCDSHHGNVMVSRRKPYLIDLEICFKMRITSYFDTMLDRAIQQGQALFFSDDRLDTRTRQAKRQIADQCLAALQKIVANIDRLKTWVRNPHMRNTVARYTTRPTPTFGSTLRGIYMEHALDPIPDPRNAGDANWNSFTGNLFQTDWTHWVQNGGRPNWATISIDHDLHDYYQCDFPCYYRRLGSTELMNCRGVKVVVAQPPPQPGANPLIAGPAYFDWDQANIRGGMNALTAVDIVELQLDALADATAGGDGLTFLQRYHRNVENTVGNLLLSFQSDGPDEMWG